MSASRCADSNFLSETELDESVRVYEKNLHRASMSMRSLIPIREKLSRILREAETTVLAVDLHVPRLLAAGVALVPSPR